MIDVKAKINEVGEKVTKDKDLKRNSRRIPSRPWRESLVLTCRMMQCRR